MTAPLIAALERRVAGEGSSPLLTYYDLAAGTRVELSARTFANWVDKTVNLMVELGADDSPAVGMPLLLSDPGHWVGLVWAMATWQVGGSVLAIPRERLKVVDLAVVGPQNTHPVPGVETVACSLHPLGAGFNPAPPAVTDYAEVLTQPDVHWSTETSPAHLAFRGVDEASRLTNAQALEVDAVGTRQAVVVSASSDPWTVLSRALVAVITGGGSTVLLTGGDEGQWSRTATSEDAGEPVLL